MLTQSKSLRSILSVLVYFIVVLNQFSMTRAADYCRISSCDNKGTQTMCQYPNSGPSSRCTNSVRAGFTDNEKSAIVNWHNGIRKKVADGLESRGSNGGQPPASNMRILKWDNELAQVAQRWADQCLSGHDKCRDVDRFQVGQNIATHWSTGEINKSVGELMEGWYNEVSIFNRNGVSRYTFSPATGHYTQLVWAETSLVGCGRVRFFDNSRNMNTVRIVCNYGDSGNWMTLPIYKIGKAASACSWGGVSRAVPSLCN